MISYDTIAIIIATLSITLNIILTIKLIQLKRELDQLKQSTRLTREELERINQRLRRLKITD
ncbi:MAG TPA: hypothetical protein EYH55_01695 [Methanothermococcus okinawensis]|uniref:Uncharacterized protein n=1 Tax=Methanothermococcus okinawensis TaxID=155863 RepID=A0A833EAT6_9EURY|nr:hypothetical protein [Methanothermococcus okinawensis]